MRHPRTTSRSQGTGPLLAASLLSAGLLTVFPLGAQTGTPSPGTHPAADSVKSTAHPHVAAAVQQHPTQAVIDEKDGLLTVRADNASLTQTLQRIADKTGMQLDGLRGDQRVFGSYGPADPRDVLTSLLNGTNYNIIMVGSLANGAPKELLLSQKSAASGNAGPANAGDDSAGGDDNGGGEDEVDPRIAPQEGMIHIDPPIQQQPMHGVRTPQQMLQQMEQMHQQQDSSGSQDPPQTPPDQGTSSQDQPPPQN